MNFELKYDTKENLQKTVGILQSNLNSIQKPEQLEILDNVFFGCDQLGLGYDWLQEGWPKGTTGIISAIGGNGMDIEVIKKELRTELNSIMGDKTAHATEIKALSETIDGLKADLEVKNSEVADLTTKLEASQNTVAKLEVDGKTISEEKASLQEKLNTIEAEAKYKDRLEKLAEAKVNMEKFGDSDYIKSLSDENFDKAIALVQSVVAEKEVATEKEKAPKVELVEASKAIPELPKSEEITPNHIETIREGFRNLKI